LVTGKQHCAVEGHECLGDRLDLRVEVVGPVIRERVPTNDGESAVGGCRCFHLLAKLLLCPHQTIVSRLMP